MESARIKNPDLAAQIDERQLAWHRPELLCTLVGSEPQLYPSDAFIFFCFCGVNPIIL